MGVFAHNGEQIQSNLVALSKFFPDSGSKIHTYPQVMRYRVLSVSSLCYKLPPSVNHRENLGGRLEVASKGTMII